MPASVTPAPSVPDFLAGYGPQQSDMLSLWTNPSAFFQQRVIFRATQANASTSLPSSGAVTKIAYDNVLEDPYSGWSAANHQWLAPVSGWYQVTVTVWVGAAGATEVVLQPYVQGTGAASNLAQNFLLSAIVLPSAAAGAAECTWYLYCLGSHDYIYGAASIQNSGSAISTSLTAGQQSSIECVWISS